VRLWRAAALLAAAVLAAAASGCASTADGDPRDPLEPLNRAVYGFNQGVDDVLAKPVATAYRDYVPEPLRVYVRNFFSNIGDLLIGFNNIIQGKPDDGLQDWARFAFNTIFGVFGINDIASDIGFEKHNEDFGQTLGRWGFGDGPYLVIPFLGSSDLRDGIGTIADIYADPLADVRPIRLRTTAYALRFTSLRADLLDASRILEEAALDKYVFQRDAYLQRRRNLVYDGRPPREEPPPEDEEKDAPEPKKGAAAPVNSTLASNVQGNNDPFQSGFPHANNY
jgi:phospholipid-binding lipoprotein MlaA